MTDGENWQDHIDEYNELALMDFFPVKYIELISRSEIRELINNLIDQLELDVFRIKDFLDISKIFKSIFFLKLKMDIFLKLKWIFLK